MMTLTTRGMLSKLKHVGRISKIRNVSHCKDKIPMVD